MGQQELNMIMAVFPHDNMLFFFIIFNLSGKLCWLIKNYALQNSYLNCVTGRLKIALLQEICALGAPRGEKDHLKANGSFSLSEVLDTPRLLVLTNMIIELGEST